MQSRFTEIKGIAKKWHLLASTPLRNEMDTFNCISIVIEILKAGEIEKPIGEEIIKSRRDKLDIGLLTYKKDEQALKVKACFAICFIGIKFLCGGLFVISGLIMGTIAALITGAPDEISKPVSDWLFELPKWAKVVFFVLWAGYALSFCLAIYGGKKLGQDGNVFSLTPKELDETSTQISAISIYLPEFSYDSIRGFIEYTVVPDGKIIEILNKLANKEKLKLSGSSSPRFFEKTKLISNTAIFAKQEKLSKDQLKEKTPSLLSPMNAEDFLNQGNFKYNLGKYQEAIKDFNEAIKLNPKYVVVFNNRGMSKYNLGQYDDAIKDFDEAIKLNSEEPTVFANRGISKYDLGQYDEAIKDFDEAIKLNPEDSTVFVNRGMSKYKLGQYDEVIKDFDAAIKLNSEEPTVFANRGMSKYNLGQYDDAIKDFDEAIKLNPEDSTVFVNRGMSKYDLGQYDEAIKDYNEAVRLDPEYAIAFYYRGVSNQALEQYNEAVRDYDETIRLEPKNGIAFRNRGLCKDGLGCYDEAINDYDEVIRLDPKDVRAIKDRGDSKRALGQYRDAINDYEEVIRLNQKDAMAWLRKGFTYLFQRNIPLAKGSFKQTLQLEVKDEDTIRMQNYAKVGLSFIEWLENNKELLVTPFFKELYDSLVISLRKIYLSCELLTKFYLIVVKENLLQTESKLKTAYRDILEVVIKTLKSCPKNPRPKYFLAELMLLIGESEIAKQYLKRCLEISPTFRLAEMLLNNCKHYHFQYPLIKDIEVKDLLSSLVISETRSASPIRDVLLATNIDLKQRSYDPGLFKPKPETEEKQGGQQVQGSFTEEQVDEIQQYAQTLMQQSGQH